MLKLPSLLPIVISTVSPNGVYADDDPLFFRGAVKPFYSSCVDEPVKDVIVDVIKSVVLILYVQNHMTPSLR